MERKDFYNDTEKRLWEMYKEECVGDCFLCQECRANKEIMSRPVSAWFVGNRFDETKTSILFVGKNARGFFPNASKEDERGVSEGINNAFSSRLDLTGKGWAFWNYTKDIIREVFGDDSQEHVALTNMVKCNDSDGVDTTTDSMKDACIKEFRVINKEIRIIRPSHIVFYTGTDYDAYIKYVFDSMVFWDQASRLMIGKYMAPWGKGVGYVNNQKIEFLRVCHPERKNKADFVKNICEWIWKTSKS